MLQTVRPFSYREWKSVYGANGLGSYCCPWDAVSPSSIEIKMGKDQLIVIFVKNRMRLGHFQTSLNGARLSLYCLHENPALVNLKIYILCILGGICSCGETAHRAKAGFYWQKAAFCYAVEHTRANTDNTYYPIIPGRSQVPMQPIQRRALYRKSGPTMARGRLLRRVGYLCTLWGWIRRMSGTKGWRIFRIPIFTGQ